MGELLLKLLLGFLMAVVGAAALVGVMTVFNLIGVPPIESGLALLIAALVLAIDDHKATQIQMVARQNELLEELVVHLRGDRAHLYERPK